MNREYDVAVVGLGGLGSAAAYWLARRGARVVAFEQFELGHVRGASHDHSRIIRRSYHTAGYVALTAAAYEAWRAVERDADEEIILRTGGIDLFPPAAGDRPGAVPGQPRRRAACRTRCSTPARSERVGRRSTAARS